MSLQATITPTALDRDGISASQTPGGAGNLTITGALASGGSVTLTDPQPVSIYSGSNIAARVFTITGTDRYGVAQTATVTGVNASTVSSTAFFKTITQIAVDAGTGAAVEAGVTGLLKSRWFPVNNRYSTFATGVAVDISGTCTFSVEYAMEPLTFTAADDAFVGWTESAGSAKTADTFLPITTPIYGVRLNVTAFTSGTLKLYIVERV
jgi:hypothetical protein